MAYLKNNQYKEIYNAYKGGNIKAAEILQALRNGTSQEELDSMVGSYYDVGGIQPVVEVPEITPAAEPEENLNTEPVIEAGTVENNVQDFSGSSIADLSSALDKDFEDILDENEISDTSFADFLSNKRRDGIKAKKNREYFGAYSPLDREKFMTSKIDAYKGKFNNRLKDIDRRYRDMDSAISMYMQNINESLDDDIELDMGTANKVYEDLTTSEDIMHGFGRSWDQEDLSIVIDSLRELVNKYGKKNVMAALNVIKTDNNNYKDYLNNQVDSEIGRYSKSIENLLK